MVMGRADEELELRTRNTFAGRDEAAGARDFVVDDAIPPQSHTSRDERQDQTIDHIRCDAT